MWPFPTPLPCQPFLLMKTLIQGTGVPSPLQHYHPTRLYLCPRKQTLPPQLLTPEGVMGLPRILPQPHVWAALEPLRALLQPQQETAPTTMIVTRTLQFESAL